MLRKIKNKYRNNRYLGRLRIENQNPKGVRRMVSLLIGGGECFIQKEIQIMGLLR